jgi:hypothetical protein
VSYGGYRAVHRQGRAFPQFQRRAVRRQIKRNPSGTVSLF